MLDVIRIPMAVKSFRMARIALGSAITMISFNLIGSRTQTGAVKRT